MRVLVSVDMEGVAGVVDGEDVRPGEREYERNRRLMTEEANAAVRGVFDADPAAEVLVSDAHAQFRNVLPEHLDRRATLLRGRPKPFGMMAGIAEDVDAVLFIGYHGRAGLAHSVLSHTINGAVVADVRCNDRSLGELGLNAALAAAHGAVPVLVAGDETVATEATGVARGIWSVVVKRALGVRAAENLHPEEACARIRAAVPQALARRTRVRPLRFSGEVEVEVEVLNPAMTEHALLVPGMELVGERTLAYLAEDFPEAYRVIQLIALLGRV
ncbi:D-amino peptidase [Crossiella equi]|uniref:D-amino peptidase n=1 Tax=Crossiella equi TaxID=130796 RepID=A0ABS5A8B4_9PSEU|nr:M55 family metallopeptidase [Crossiella equi]MBP2472830.1 D-amino peptidase [Crossiella equi]